MVVALSVFVIERLGAGTFALAMSPVEPVSPSPLRTKFACGAAVEGTGSVMA
jgi:hypothetical protein